MPFKNPHFVEHGPLRLLGMSLAVAQHLGVLFVAVFQCTEASEGESVLYQTVRAAARRLVGYTPV